jgi:hypothetical protein
MRVAGGVKMHGSERLQIQECFADEPGKESTLLMRLVGFTEKKESKGAG